MHEELNKFEQALLECPLTMFVKFTFFYLLAGKRDGSHVNPIGTLFTDTTERSVLMSSRVGGYPEG